MLVCNLLVESVENRCKGNTYIYINNLERVISKKNLRIT
ncbi:hypothetical protein HMPREF9720_0150 [Alistipes sp. HGB5]|nr:hypothetical protein HMPREF9720_0150 [Alistipes sp. HGB5]